MKNLNEGHHFVICPCIVPLSLSLAAKSHDISWSMIVPETRFDVDNICVCLLLLQQSFVIWLEVKYDCCFLHKVGKLQVAFNSKPYKMLMAVHLRYHCGF